jgi:hypothetical protein
VSNNASISINGSNQIQLSLKMKLFESDRLEPEYAMFRTMGNNHSLQMAAQNIINHLTIKMPLSVY